MSLAVKSEKNNTQATPTIADRPGNGFSPSFVVLFFFRFFFFTLCHQTHSYCTLIFIHYLGHPALCVNSKLIFPDKNLGIRSKKTSSSRYRERELLLLFQELESMASCFDIVTFTKSWCVVHSKQ